MTTETPSTPSSTTPNASPTLSDAFKGVSLDSMRRVVKTECGRNSLLYGIGGGMAIGLARFMISRQVLTSTNWAVGGFTLISLGSWEWCRYQLLQKAQKMDLIVEKLNQLEEKKRKQKQQQQQQQQQQEEQKS